MEIKDIFSGSGNTLGIGKDFMSQKWYLVITSYQIEKCGLTYQYENDTFCEANENLTAKLMGLKRTKEKYGNNITVFNQTAREITMEEKKEYFKKWQEEKLSLNN